ncbi:MAG: glycosyl hydrolase family 18 protein [Acidimicrobiales bacterium]
MNAHRGARYVALIAMVTLLTTSTSLSAGAAHRLAITGYIEEGSAARYIHDSAAALTNVGVDGVSLNADATSVSSPDASALSLLASAHRNGLRGDLLINNYSNNINNFSASLAAKLLSSQHNINLVAVALARIVREDHWNGVTVDLESLSANDARGMIDLLRTLRGELRDATSLSVDVGAARSVLGYLEEGFNLKALASVATNVTVMTYDQHGPWSGPGPIGALGWQVQCLRALLRVVPARRVDLGVAGYGYTWPYGSRLHDGVALSDAEARQMVTAAHATAHWNKASGEWTAVLPNYTVLWWSDAHSFALRLRLAEHFNLHGVALWQLASSDPLTN